MKRLFETILVWCLITFLSGCMHATISPLNQAISKGDMNGLRLLADKGANLNERGECDRFTDLPPLICAARYGNNDMIKLLLDKGVDVNTKAYMWTPLSMAATKGNSATIQLLMDNGADMNKAVEGLEGFVNSYLAKYPNNSQFIEEEKSALEFLKRYAQKQQPSPAVPAAALPSATQAEPPRQGGVYPTASAVAKDRPKFAVWDLAPLNINRDYAQALTSILVSEISKLQKYEVYSQENVRTLAGWTAERMQFGCTDTKCLTALGQMDIAKLISGSVGKIGNTYSISLNLFDTQNAKSEKSVSEFCKTEDDLIPLVQGSVRKLLGEVVATAAGAMLKDSVTGMEFVFVKGGCYQMGDTFGYGRGDDKPVHEVCVDDFYMGKYEVTQGEWKEIMENNPSGFRNCGDRCPVESVSWNDAQGFISRLNQKTQKKFRLPTEAEWEYAARSGGKKEKWSGTSSQSELGEYAWVAWGSEQRTHPVGEKRPNGLGLYDMTGNVREWCADWYGEDYYQNSPKDNPLGPANRKYRVFRGGSWIDDPAYTRAQFRYWLDPATRSGVTGFRLVLPAR
jgi:formylglycine-generating enzyme